ncbi:MAG: phospholipid-binding lipoprotein MlaA [Psychrobacter glaciei]|jgi:phospholipid-binding lipoprotein MlaA
MSEIKSPFLGAFFMPAILTQETVFLCKNSLSFNNTTVLIWRPFLGHSLMRLFTILFLCFSFSAQAAEQDPWEDWNRDVFAFNETLDKYALKPVAQAYRNVTPVVVDNAITNVFSNLGEPFIVINDVFQGKFLQALSDTGRFIVNSTVGVLGIFDVASHIGLPKHAEDFGQTLAYWGVESGPYIMIPVLGPSTVRDATGFSVDTFAFLQADPKIHAFDNSTVYYGSVYAQYLDIRADFIPAEGIISGDRYSFIRSLYLQRRDFLINDGQTSGVDDDFDDEFEDDFDSDF